MLRQSTIKHVLLEDNNLQIVWANGQQSQFNYRWLRDNCPSPKSRHENGQRLIETALIPADIHPEHVQLTSDNQIQITWANDNHISPFAGEWLWANAPTVVTNKPTPYHLWSGQTLPNFPDYDYADICRDETMLSDWLKQVHDYGFALLRQVPAESTMVTQVANLFGYVRETNYGRHFEVKSVANPNNLAYTGLALSPHTDNPYRDPVPTLQLLHCLNSSVDGGDSVLVDGFQVAEAIRQETPAYFDLLAKWPIRFRFQDEETNLIAEVPIMRLDHFGNVEAIRFNNRSAEPFQMPVTVIDDYYDAYQAFARKLDDPTYQYRFKLQPGDLFIVDNLRVLHGRTGFASSGERHLQGCYADRDGLYSRLRILRGSDD
ncbi:MAG: TauD/TfdA family dioxygenase [Chloroflexota bacterium]